MKHRSLWIILILILAGLLLAGCKGTTETAEKVVPAEVVEIEGSELKQVILTEKAAERINLQTVAVREESITKRRTILGEVVAQMGDKVANPNQLWVRVPINGTDKKLVARNQPARLLASAIDDEEDSDDEEDDMLVKLDELPGQDDDEDSALYYKVDSAITGLLSGQKVFVDVSLSDGAVLRKVIPYAALIYDADGGTWIYVEDDPATRTFVRYPVTVDFIDGDLVVLTEGPPAGTKVVTVGGQELFGAETGVSK